MLMNRFETSSNHLFPQKRSFHMTDESNFTVVGNIDQRWKPGATQVKLMLAPHVSAICPVDFSVVYQCKPLHRSAILHW